MKKITTLGLAVFGLAAGAFAQGSVEIDNSIINPGVAIYTPGNYYTGTFGLDVYELNTTTLPSNINPYNGVNPLLGYNNMIADGYSLQASFVSQTMSSPGTFALGELKMPGVSPAGATVALALVAWDDGGNSPLTAPNMGVITFLNPTANYTLLPPPTPPLLSGWGTLNQDLVMGTPEPSSFALASLGVAAFMLNRRKK